MSSWLTRIGLVLSLGLGSCGYTHGVRLPAGAESVGVEVFGNLSEFPSVERELFACLSDEAGHMVQGKLIAPQRAEIVIRGNILDYRRLLGVQTKDAELLSSGVQINLQAWLVDTRAGERIGEVLEFDQAVRYILKAKRGEFNARSGALRHLCQEILLDLFNQEAYLGASQSTDGDNDTDTGSLLDPTTDEDLLPQGGTPE